LLSGWYDLHSRRYMLADVGRPVDCSIKGDTPLIRRSQQELLDVKEQKLSSGQANPIVRPRVEGIALTDADEGVQLRLTYLSREAGTGLEISGRRRYAPG
jgi:hypothetical protein